jgi:hypothetical protein
METLSYIYVELSHGSFGAAVKLLPCDHEVMGSSPGNSHLKKCKERLCTFYFDNVNNLKPEGVVVSLISSMPCLSHNYRNEKHGWLQMPFLVYTQQLLACPISLSISF